MFCCSGRARRSQVGFEGRARCCFSAGRKLGSIEFLQSGIESLGKLGCHSGAQLRISIDCAWIVGAGGEHALALSLDVGCCASDSQSQTTLSVRLLVL